MRPHLRLLACAALTLSLTACYWPQNYKLNVHVSKDGTVKLNYQGQLVSLTPRMAVAEARQKGQTLTSKDQAQLAEVNKQTLSEFKKDPLFKSAEYIGNDTFKVRIEDTHKLKEGQKYDPLMNLLTIRRTGKKVLIEAQSIGSEEQAQLKALGLTASGEINITTDARVVSHNASPSGLFGKTYRWKMNRLNAPAPVMTLNLP